MFRSFYFGSMIVLIVTACGCGQEPASATAAEGNSKVPEQLRNLFVRLDELGRSKVEMSNFVELTLSNAEAPERRWTERACLLNQDNKQITVLTDDLVAWTYEKKGTTTVPSSWSPTTVKLESVKESSLEEYCKELTTPAKDDDDRRIARRLYAVGPSQRLLVAHAAWKHKLAKYCEPIIVADLKSHEGGYKEYEQAVLEDLAWNHFLRGVNLLMYADRKDVIPHLQLVLKLSPNGKYAPQAKDLLSHLEKMVAEEPKKPAKDVDEGKLTESERAEYYVSQLTNLRCPQMSQPGFIELYLAVVDGQPNDHPPTTKLRKLGMAAVPALIKALEDDRPTRTIYHWRSFARSRIVWRVSDFAWNILRDITQRDFGYRPIVGFTLGSMQADERKQAVAEIKKWYADNKDLSPDEQMLKFFSSKRPEDWIAAGEYFAAKGDKRAVEPLLEKIPRADRFRKGDLCELVGKFDDPRAKDVLKNVLDSAEEPSDRISAAIGLWGIGDPSGIPIVIEFVKAKGQPYGNWEEPVWFLIRTRTKEGMEALKSVVTEAPPKRAGEVVRQITRSITGDLWGQRREPVGCVEIAQVLLAALDRADPTGGEVNDIKVRIKDQAATAFVLLKDGTDDTFPGDSPDIDPDVFNQLEPQAVIRDGQIEVLKNWYDENKDRLAWDAEKGHLILVEQESK